MAIPPISGNYNSAVLGAVPVAAKAAETARTEKGESAVQASSKENKDTFVKSKDVEAEGYKEPKRLSADQLKAIQEQQVTSFKNMLSKMLTSQADKAKVAGRGLNINADMFSRILVTPEQKAEAEKAISEDGEWGVNAVATRIMDMAVALSGGDTSKISTLRTAVEKGFQQAGVQWGQKLPGICGDTRDEIDKRFDYWEKNGSLNGYEYQSAAAGVEDK